MIPAYRTEHLSAPRLFIHAWRTAEGNELHNGLKTLEERLWLDYLDASASKQYLKRFSRADLKLAIRWLYDEYVAHMKATESKPA